MQNPKSGAPVSVEEKLKKAKVSLDRSLEDHSKRRMVTVRVPVEGGRGRAAVEGSLSFDQLKSGGYIKQRQRDLFTLRCRCPGGRVPAEWLRAAAEVSERFGKGYVHLSFRQSLEIPYIHYKDFPEATDILSRAGARVATCGPRVRVPTACAGCEYNPNGLTDTQAMTRLVDGEFFGEEIYHKFKISFSGCPIDCARTNEMDLAFQGAQYPAWSEETCSGCALCSKACLEGAIAPHSETGAPIFESAKCLYCADCIRACPTESWKAAACGWIVRVGGRHGRHPHNGSVVAHFIPDSMVAPVIRATIDWYRENGKGKGRTRIGELLKAPGAMRSYLDALEPAAGPLLVKEARPPEPIVIHGYAGNGAAPGGRSAGTAAAVEPQTVVHRRIDATGAPCPGPFAIVKQTLDEMEPGQTLEATVDEDNLASLSKSVKEEGHRIVGVKPIDGTRFRLHIERRSD